MTVNPDAPARIAICTSPRCSYREPIPPGKTTPIRCPACGRPMVGECPNCWEPIREDSPARCPNCMRPYVRE